MRKKSPHPPWAVRHRKPGTELKRISGRYYLYGAASEYDKITKKTKKKSLGILGSITEKDGFIPSPKAVLRESKSKPLAAEQVYAYEYGFSSWLKQRLEQSGIEAALQRHFPTLWKYIIAMAYCRLLHQSPLKNVPFHLSTADLMAQLGTAAFTDREVSHNLRLLGGMRAQMAQYMRDSFDNQQCVLMDATPIVCHSKNIGLAQQGYNSRMNFDTQFTWLYLYSAKTMEPLFFRIIPGNVREISGMKNTVKESGLTDCIFIADKGFYSESNKKELVQLGLPFIIPLKRNNASVDYNKLPCMDASTMYFSFRKRPVFFHQQSTASEVPNEKLCLFLDGALKEQERQDYLRRIGEEPEECSREKYLQKAPAMGTLALLHNTALTPEKVFEEYKGRCEIEQLFDHLKNTLDASVSHMQNEEALQGWMFVNHIAMQVLCQLWDKLKKAPLNKTQMLNKKFSVADAIRHLAGIQKIMINSPQEHYLTECNVSTKTLLKKLGISIT